MKAKKKEEGSKQKIDCVPLRHFIWFELSKRRKKTNCVSKKLQFEKLNEFSFELIIFGHFLCEKCYVYELTPFFLHCLLNITYNKKKNITTYYFMFCFHNIYRNEKKILMRTTPLSEYYKQTNKKKTRKQINAKQKKRKKPT